MVNRKLRKLLQRSPDWSQMHKCFFFFSNISAGRKRHYLSNVYPRIEVYVLFLEREYGIPSQITDIDSFSPFLDIRMFSAQQPTHMCEEKSSLRIMGIRVRFGVFMVKSVIPGPIDRRILPKKVENQTIDLDEGFDVPSAIKKKKSMSHYAPKSSSNPIWNLLRENHSRRTCR